VVLAVAYKLLGDWVAEADEPQPVAAPRERVATKP
jgi:hypothetical protein